ncbi:MAG TPA: TolC family protein, partial [Silvibacterium sp.]|nr:TolC family protein [Silvibacterium sp.]
MNVTPLKRIPAALLIPLAVVLLSVTGCTVGPNYVRPHVETPTEYRGANDTAVSSANQNSLGDESWAKVFNEPELQELLRTALANNYNVRIAAQQVLEAQAQLRITRAQQFPTVSVGGTGVGADLGKRASGAIGSSIPSGAIAEGSFDVSAAFKP